METLTLSALNSSKTQVIPLVVAAPFCVAHHRLELREDQKEAGVYYYLSMVSWDSVSVSKSAKVLSANKEKAMGQR